MIFSRRSFLVGAGGLVTAGLVRTVYGCGGAADLPLEVIAAGPHRAHGLVVVDGRDQPRWSSLSLPSQRTPAPVHATLQREGDAYRAELRMLTFEKWKTLASIRERIECGWTSE